MLKKGYFMQTQPFSVNDGEGIRTIIFMAGCPLHCRWCANPEGIRQTELVGFYSRNCIACGECEKVCPQGIGIDLNAEREKCIGCGACAEVCPKGARKQLVSFEDADNIIKEIKKHDIFYRTSGGGITFSGGEATAQPALLNYLSEELYDLGYSLAMETCGYFDFDQVKDSLVRMDLIFMDLKHMDSEMHEKYTGVTNEKILENMKRLREIGAEIVIRIPVIEGVNATEENIRQSALFVKEFLPKARMELLPYHKFGFGKYEALGYRLPSEDFSAPDADKMKRFIEIIRDVGVEIADYK